MLSLQHTEAALQWTETILNFHRHLASTFHDSFAGMSVAKYKLYYSDSII